MYDIISLLIHRLFSAQRQRTTSDKSRAEAWEDAKVFKQHCLLPALVILVQYMVGCTTELQLINSLLTILTNYLLGVCTQL